jgi:hypothetical protein
MYAQLTTSSSGITVGSIVTFMGVPAGTCEVTVVVAEVRMVAAKVGAMGTEGPIVSTNLCPDRAVTLKRTHVDVDVDSDNLEHLK